jgi:hypothetical protein
MPMTSKCSLSLTSPSQSPVCTSHSTHTCHIPRPPHSSLFYRVNNLWWGAQIMKLLIMQSSPLPCYLVPLRPKYPLQHPILQHPKPTFLAKCQRPSLTPR